ncbi:MAG: hypothetical protein GY949_06090 [Gammaproteobacteria bacterium]|nr:hypothetical protein [Gammaproteobacteria bacterium]
MTQSRRAAIGQLRSALPDLSRGKMKNSREIIQEVRRSYLTSFFKFVVVIGILLTIGVWAFAKWDYSFVGVGLLIVGALQLYVGQYIPLRNRHDSLLNKYGDVYVDEVNRAIARYGVAKLTSTHWFETYADEFCERSKIGDAKEPDD